MEYPNLNAPTPINDHTDCVVCVAATPPDDTRPVWIVEAGDKLRASVHVGGLAARISQYGADSGCPGDWYWCVNLPYPAQPSVGGIAKTDIEAAALIADWLAKGATAITEAWAKEMVEKIDSLVRELRAEAPHTTMRLPGYSQGRQDGYDAARSAICGLFSLMPSTDLEDADAAVRAAEDAARSWSDVALQLQERLDETGHGAGITLSPSGELRLQS